MVLPFAAALALFMAAQSPAVDRSHAEQLARSGQTEAALNLFEQIVSLDPTDREARLWIARLQLRIGRTEEAEATFRAVHLEDPKDVDARIGLGAALTRRNAWRQALEVLLDAEQDAGQNSDLFGALARAYRRAGDDRRALECYKRAKALAPNDPDLVEGYEATLRVYGSSIEVEGLAEGGASDARSAALTAAVRVLPRLLVKGGARVQRKSGARDADAGGGVIVRLARPTNLEVRLAGGVDNVSLPNRVLMAEVRHYLGAFEFGANVRRMSYTGAAVSAASPILAWEGERWRFGARYTYSVSSFDATGETSGDNSVLVRETFQAWRRVALMATYAYGIESFEDLTADRIANLGGNTIAGTVKIALPSVTALAATWEHQRRSNDTVIDRLTLVLVQSLP